MMIFLKTTRSLLFILVIACTLLKPIQIYASTLYAILIGDTQSNLKKQASADLEQMQEGVNFIAHVLKIKPQIHVLKGTQVNKERVFSTLNHLPIKQDDILIFYFTGHGFSFPNKESKWPTIHFYTDKQYLEIDLINSAIAKKKPRFAIVMADCCNVTLSNYRRAPTNKRIHFSSGDRSRVTSDLEKLFLKSKGLLVISASSQGEFSWANDQGGFLTIAFLDSFTAPSHQESRTWDDVMQKVILKTRGIQTPQYQFMPY